ncbi:4-hydroxybenzoate polyprenyltransferase, mitochondrial-like isoform X2 [Nymphaea colorata]|uniref:4-hydroxybenzoate polyprenyltransferase, mitochondrial-like isoform X2 n=1 Tax=Nymphaea colorata TaxID=210225 RepID=UPI00129EEB48|nr:4-hydroxybenzoate polyprenyltransferase, mitochondrial-like isoform X2 [Nymphaea colorata]
MASAASLLLEQTAASVSSWEKRVATSPPKAAATFRTKLASSSTWLDHLVPATLRPYAYLARIDKPVGTWLVAWPQMWGIALAATPGRLPDLSLLWVLAWASFFARGAGCTINDILDRDFDAKVQRTKSRPIACGLLTPFEATLFLVIQLLLYIGALSLTNTFCLGVGIATLLLVFSYPLMKRLTYWPQAYLGMTMNCGVLLGWSAVKGSLTLADIFPLYSSGVFWTIIYDTIYAHQDKKDDVKAGVKSTALRFGESTKSWISGFGVASFTFFLLTGYTANLGWPYYAFLAASATQLVWQIWTLDISRPEECEKKFESNKYFGALVFFGILTGKLVQ